jgi:hypothetical protein
VGGQVVLVGGPIGVSVVFGPEVARTVEPRRWVRYDSPPPVRYRRGMALAELDYYRERIEYEYDLYRRMRADDAYFHLGWTRGQLRDYVQWLRQERKFLRDEHKRLSRLYDHDFGGRGRGRGVARGNPHR